MGLITRETLEELLRAQRENHIRIGESVVECKMLDREVMEEALPEFLEERTRLEKGGVK